MADVEPLVVERGRPAADRFAPADVQQHGRDRGRQLVRIDGHEDGGTGFSGPIVDAPGAFDFDPGSPDAPTATTGSVPSRPTLTVPTRPMTVPPTTAPAAPTTTTP